MRLCPIGKILLGMKCPSLATGLYITLPGRLAPPTIPKVTAPEVAVPESILSSKVKIKSLVLAAMVVPLVGKTPTIAGAELSA